MSGQRGKRANQTFHPLPSRALEPHRYFNRQFYLAFAALPCSFMNLAKSAQDIRFLLTELPFGSPQYFLC